MGELSLDAGLVAACRTASKRLAELSGRFDEHHQEEPYRRAITTMIARLSSAAAVLGHDDLVQARGSASPPYATAADLASDLGELAPLAHGERRRVAGARAAALAPPCRRCLRLSSRRHRSPPELRRSRARRRGASGPRRIARLRRHATRRRAWNACSPRFEACAPLVTGQSSYSEETARELAIVQAAAEAHRLYGAASVPNYVISKTDSVSDILEVALILKEAWLLRPGAELGAQYRPALRDDRRPAQLPADHGAAFRPARLPRHAEEPRRRPGGDARLFRQQQGRRVPDRELGALQGRARPDRGVPQARRRASRSSTAAAARSAAAAVRPIRRSSASRTAPCRARSASPSRAR